MSRKTFVSVLVAYDVFGTIKPLSINWKDGTKFAIDQILEIKRAASLKAGGNGLRYTIRIENQITYLFFDELEKKWFVEEK